MPGFLGTPGVTRITNKTDAVVGASGSPVRVFDFTVVATNTATVAVLRNGTTTGGTNQLQLDAAANKCTTWTSANGLLFDGGLFADVDANTTAVTISWMPEL